MRSVIAALLLTATLGPAIIMAPGAEAAPYDLLEFTVVVTDAADHVGFTDIIGFAFAEPGDDSVILRIEVANAELAIPASSINMFFNAPAGAFRLGVNADGTPSVHSSSSGGIESCETDGNMFYCIITYSSLGGAVGSTISETWGYSYAGAASDYAPGNYIAPDGVATGGFGDNYELVGHTPLGGALPPVVCDIDGKPDVDCDDISDEWEQENFGDLNQTGTDDPDMDNLTNRQEEFQGTDPNNADTDGDGSSDGDEVLAGTDPLDADSTPSDSGSGEEPGSGTDGNETAGPLDTDSDGVSDEDEATLGTDPNKADSDDDGFSDGDEVAAGTDPLDFDSFPGSNSASTDKDYVQILKDDMDYAIISAAALVAVTVLVIVALAGRWK